MRKAFKFFIAVLLILGIAETSYAMSINLQPAADELLRMEDVTKRVFNKTTTIKPGDAVTVLEYLYAVKKGLKDIDPGIAEKLSSSLGKTAVKEFGNVAAERVLDAAIEVMAEDFEKTSGIDKYQFQLLMKSVKNVVLSGGNPAEAIRGQVIDVAFIVHDSWKETRDAVKQLPPDAPMDSHLRELYILTAYTDAMKNDGNYLNWIQAQIAIGGISFTDGLKIYWDYIKGGGGKLVEYVHNLVNNPNIDASKLANLIVGNVTNLDNEAPRLVKTDIAVSRGATSKLSLSYTFNEPMSNRVGFDHIQGFCGPAGCAGTWSDFKWSNNRKTAVTTFTPSGGSYVSPPGSIVTWSTTSSTFRDLSGNSAPAKSGSFTLK